MSLSAQQRASEETELHQLRENKSHIEAALKKVQMLVRFSNPFHSLHRCHSEYADLSAKMEDVLATKIKHPLFECDRVGCCGLMPFYSLGSSESYLSPASLTASNLLKV